MDKYENATIDCSIVVPLYNEELAVSELYRRLTDTMKKTGLTYEIILVDDGSTDKTLDLTKDIAEKDAAVTLVELRRNFGQTRASAAFVRRNKSALLDNTSSPKPSGNGFSAFGEDNTGHDYTQSPSRALIQDCAKSYKQALPVIRENPFVIHGLWFPGVSFLLITHIGRMSRLF